MAPKKISSENPQKIEEAKKTTASNVTAVIKKTEESPGMPCVTIVKGLLQITEVSLQSSVQLGKKIFVFCKSACSNSWISEILARKLNVQGKPLKLTVHGIKSNQTIDT